MLDAFGNDKSLLWLQINRAIFEIDDEVPLQDKEELVVVVMFVPVVLALHDAEANNGVVHLTKRLVIPLLGAGFYQGWYVHQVERRKLYIEVSGVRIILLFAHGQRMIQPGFKRCDGFPNTWGNADISKEKQECDVNRNSAEEVL